MANQFTFTRENAEQLILQGELSRHTIEGKQDKVFRVIGDSNKQTVCLSKVDNVDTAGVAWLLTLLEYAQNHKVELTFSNMSDELIKLAKLSQVIDILPITE